MNTTSFLTALRAHGSLPLAFRAGGEIVAAGYHLTEVRHVAYETIDCGAGRHDWAETQFEIWAPGSGGAGDEHGRGHMAAAKFLQIVDRVEASLPFERTAVARIHASFAGQPAALHDIEAVTAREGRLWVDLTPDRTRCKAAERQSGSGAGACCGTTADPAAAACGCDNTKREPAAAACCA